MDLYGLTSLVATPKVMCHTRAVDTIAKCNLSHIAISTPWLVAMHCKAMLHKDAKTTPLTSVYAALFVIIAAF